MVAALALCSAGGGGKDYLSEVSSRGMLAGDSDSHARVAAEANRLTAAGLGDRMIALPGWWYAITAASWLDLSENVPSTVEKARRYPGPILALRGGLEQSALYPAEAVAAAAGGRAELVVIEGGDHFYNGVETAFARVVSRWFKGLPG